MGRKRESGRGRGRERKRKKDRGRGRGRERSEKEFHRDTLLLFDTIKHLFKIYIKIERERGGEIEGERKRET